MASSPSCPIPGKPRLWIEEKDRSQNIASISFRVPPCMFHNPVDSFTIYYQALGGDENEWKKKNVAAPERSYIGEVKSKIKLCVNRTYVFAVQATYEDGVSSERGDLSDNFTLDQNAASENLAFSLIDSLKGSTDQITKSKSFSLYQLDLELTFEDKEKGIKVYELGECNVFAKEIVILLVGATGSGKSTFINVLVNYLFGISRECDARFRLTEEEEQNADQTVSQTKSVIAYKIHSVQGMKIPNTSFTIIDTPGFGDTSGIKEDEKITKQIKTFFEMAEQVKIKHIDAVGFVAQSSLARLTHTQQYIFDCILSIFGRDIAENMLMLLTFSDNREPNVIGGLKKAGVTFRKHFKFNNSALFNERDMKNDMMEHLFWEMGEDSLQFFFEEIGQCTPKSLALTKDVLHLRQKLELDMKQLQDAVQSGLNKLERLRKEMELLDLHEKEIAENRCFEYTVEEERWIKRPINKRTRTTFCLDCVKTCHTICTIPKKGSKINCICMDDEGNCTQCEKRCSYGRHTHVDFTIDLVREKVRKTSNALKTRYDKGMEGRISTINLANEIKSEFDKEQDKTLLLIELNRRTVAHLNDIALKPCPMSTLDYIDTMIAAEQKDRMPGFGKRIEELMKIRMRAEECGRLLEEGYNPFESHKAILDEFMEKENARLALAERYTGILGKPLKWYDGLKRKLKKDKKQ